MGWARAGVNAGHKCFEGFFLKCLAIFFRQEIVNKKLETHPVKSYITKQLFLMVCEGRQNYNNQKLRRF